MGLYPSFYLNSNYYSDTIGVILTAAIMYVFYLGQVLATI